MRVAWIPLASALFATAALASPWTLKQGELVVVGHYDLEYADREYLADETSAQSFPLNGEYRAATYGLGARIGVTDWFEIEAHIPIKQVTYTSDPVILLPTEAGGQEAFDYYQENVIDLSRSESGVGDIDLVTRFRLWSGAFAGAAEVRLKTPTGYDPPQGTFGDRPTSEEQFLSDPVRFVRPENVADDVTLGDGQLDLTPSILIGWATRIGLFTRLDLGYKLRLGDAGDQLVGSARVGQLIAGRLLVFVGAGVEYSLFDGEVIGISVAAENPNLPATEYGGLNNLVLKEVTLDHDRITVPAGLIFRVTREVELNATYIPTVWGRNVAQVHTVSLGVGVKTTLSE